MMDSHNDSTGLAATHTHTRHHHLSLPCSFVSARRPTRPAGCQMELTRSQPALSLLSPAALEGKPSSEAKATSPRQIPLLCHSAGTSVFVSQRVCLPLRLRRLSAGLLLKARSKPGNEVGAEAALEKCSL